MNGLVKDSEYKVYRELKWQEVMNPKNKFDNRLYVSMRYKNFDYFTQVGDEIFKTNFNRDTFRKVLVNTNLNLVSKKCLLV